MTAIRLTSGARCRRPRASATSWPSGAVSHILIGGKDGSVILASYRECRHERQLRSSLPCDAHGNLGSKPRLILSKPRHRLRDEATFGNHDVRQQMSAIRGRRNFFDKDFVALQLRVTACERQVQRTLDLTTELLCFPQYLAVG